MNLKKNKIYLLSRNINIGKFFIIKKKKKKKKKHIFNY